MSAAQVAAPSFGPAIVTVFGHSVPVVALSISIVGLIVARHIAPPPLRILSSKQEFSLTVLLVAFLFVVVTGGFGGEPLGVGMAFVWGVGLGLSGLMAVELIGDRVMVMLKALIGHKDKKDDG